MVGERVSVAAADQQSDAHAREGSADQPDPRRWKALSVCLVGGFMVLLDVSIVNVEQHHEAADEADRQRLPPSRVRRVVRSAGGGALGGRGLSSGWWRHEGPLYPAARRRCMGHNGPVVAAPAPPHS